MTHCAYCPPAPKLAAIGRRKDLPRILRRLIGAVQAAKHAEWASVHALHGGFSSRGAARPKGTSERVALHLAADSRSEWVSALVLLLNWSRS
jgi:hypothetical protein